MTKVILIKVPSQLGILWALVLTCQNFKNSTITHNLIPLPKLTPKMNVIPFKSNKRSRPNPKRGKSRQATVSRGLRMYLDTRGTPKGAYEVNRTVSGYLDTIASTFSIGAGNTEAMCFTVSPQNIYAIAGTGLNSYAQTVPNASELAALFDKVKIHKVEWTFSCLNPGTLNSGTGNLPQILFASDDNDATCSTAQVQQMDTRVWQPGYGRDFKITTYPKYQRLIYYTSLVSSYEPATGYVVSQTDIQHYGLKLAIAQNVGAISGRINWSAKIFFKFREIK